MDMDSFFALGGFRLLERLSSGGSSLCFKAARQGEARVFALKLFCPASLREKLRVTPEGVMVLEDASAEERRRFLQSALLFRREAAVCGELCALYGERSNNDYFYYAALTELEDYASLIREGCDGPEWLGAGAPRYGAFLLCDTTGGEPLSDLLRRRKLHDDREQGALTALAWTRRIAEAAAQLHGHLGRDGSPAPYLHLDIKPDNIYCTRLELDGDEGRRVFRMLDLGSAFPLGKGEEDRRLRLAILPRLTSTLHYAAPELGRQVNHPDPGEALRLLRPETDVYSIAAILFEMVTGQPYDCDELELSSPALDAIPESARSLLKEELLRPALERPAESRLTLAALTRGLDRLRRVIENRGVCREVLFTGARRFARALPETPQEALLARCRLVPEESASSPAEENLFALLDSTRGHLFLQGSGMRGKTFALLHAAVTLTECYRPDAPVPLYVPLRAFRDAGDKANFVRDYILSRYAGRLDEDDAELPFLNCFRETAGDAPGFLLLADGLNEAAGEEDFGALVSELSRLMALPGIRVVLSAQSDMRQTNFMGLGLGLAELAALDTGQIDGYLSASGLPPVPEGDSLRQVLESPMLLKMYALSERAVIDRSLLRDPRFRFLPSARTASQIMLNYREYVLSKLWDNRSGGSFGAYCLLVREFLPYLACQLCTDEFWFGISRNGIESILNFFFHRMTLPESAMELREYGYPAFGEDREEERSLASFDKDIARVRTVESLLLADSPDGLLRPAEKMLLDFGYFDSKEELQQLLDPQWQKSADPYGDLRLTSLRNGRVLNMLLGTGLLRLEDRWYSLAHDSMREIFCADGLLQSLLRHSGPESLKSELGRYHLSRAVCLRLGELCGEDCASLRGALESLRGFFDPINSQSLAGYGNEALELLSENWINFSNLIWIINMSLNRKRPLTADDLDELLETDDLPFEIPDSTVFPLLPVLSAQNLTLRFTLGDRKEHTRLTLFNAVEYAGAMGGSFATAAANLTEALLLRRGTLAGEDLSRLDLSRARLRTAPLSGARLDGAFLMLDDLRELDLPGDSGYRRMEYGPSGRFLYLAYTKTLFCLDLWEEGLVFSLAVSPETHGDAALVHFILLPEQGWLAVILSDNTVCIINAGTGEGLLEFCPPDGETAQGFRLTCAVPQPEGRLGVQLEGEHRQMRILQYYLVQEEDGSLSARLELTKDHSHYTQLEEFKSGKTSRPGYVLQRLGSSFRELTAGGNAAGGQPRQLGRKASGYLGAVYSRSADRIAMLSADGLEEYSTKSGLLTSQIVFRSHRVQMLFLDEVGQARPVTADGRIWCLEESAAIDAPTAVGKVLGTLKHWIGPGRRLENNLIFGVDFPGMEYLTDLAGQDAAQVNRRLYGGWPAVLTGDGVLLTLSLPDPDTAVVTRGTPGEPGIPLCRFDPFPDAGSSEKGSKKKLLLAEADLGFLGDTACSFIYNFARRLTSGEELPARAGLCRIALSAGTAVPVDTAPLLAARVATDPRLLKIGQLKCPRNRRGSSLRVFLLSGDTVLLSFFDAWLTLEVSLSDGQVLERYDAMAVADLRQINNRTIVLLDSPIDLSDPQTTASEHAQYYRKTEKRSKKAFALRRLGSPSPSAAVFVDASPLAQMERLEVSGASMRGIMPEPTPWDLEFFRRCGAVFGD